MAERRGTVDPSRFPDEEFQLFSIPAFDDGKPERLMGSEIGSAKQVVRTGDVLFSRIVPHIRRAWIVGPADGARQIGSGEWIVFRSPTLDARYLRHFLLTDGFYAQIAKTLAGVGGSLMRARPSEVAKIEIPLPPLQEQKRIAAILDKTDAIRGKRDQAIKLTNEFLRSIFLEMFGDPGHNPKGWPRKAFAEILSIPLRNGISPSSDGTIPARVLTLSAITGRVFDPGAAKTGLFVEPTRPEKFVDARDFLICRGNGNLHLVGRGKFPARLVDTAFPDTMIAARVGLACDKHYLELLWDTPCLRQQIEQGARTTNGTFKVNQQLLEGLQLPMPPLKLQKEFGTIRDSIQATTHRMQVQEKEHQSLSSALATKAFAGDL